MKSGFDNRNIWAQQPWGASMAARSSESKWEERTTLCCWLATKMGQRRTGKKYCDPPSPIEGLSYFCSVLGTEVGGGLPHPVCSRSRRSGPSRGNYSHAGFVIKIKVRAPQAVTYEFPGILVCMQMLQVPFSTDQKSIPFFPPTSK